MLRSTARFLLVSFTIYDDSGDGTTLLHLACGVGLFDLAVRVLERRADVALEHRYFGAPLLLAAEQGGDPARRSGDGLLGTWNCWKTAGTFWKMEGSAGQLDNWGTFDVSFCFSWISDEHGKKKPIDIQPFLANDG